MTVGELKKALCDVPDDWPVILSADGEGNGFATLSSVELARWDAKERETKLFALTDVLIAKGFGEDDVNPDLPPAIVLWP